VDLQRDQPSAPADAGYGLGSVALGLVGLVDRQVLDRVHRDLLNVGGAA
jgi:hypothetical protein